MKIYVGKHLRKKFQPKLNGIVMEDNVQKAKSRI